MKIYPWEYTDQEGGIFKMWPGTYVTRKELSQRGRTVLIQGIKVHSLIFETSAAYVCGDLVPRWDSLNGWTKTIKQAKKLWPEGYHGEKPTLQSKDR